MESQNIFAGIGDFGTSSPGIISDETADLVFGGGAPTEDVKTVKPIEDSKEEESVEQEEQVKPTLTADDILGEEEEEEKPKPTKKKKQEDTEEQDEDEEEGEGSEDSDNRFAILTDNLIKMGIFSESEDGEEVKTPEQFAQKWIDESRKKANAEIYNIISKHGEEGINAFKAIFVDGVSPREFMASYATIEEMSDLDISIEGNQERVYREYYRRQGWSQEKIDKKLARTKDYGDLEDEAKDLHELLIAEEKENLEAMSAQQRQNEQLRVRQQEEYRNNMNKILYDKLKAKEFDGIPVTEKVARSTYDFLTTEKWRLPSGELLTDFDKYILELRDPRNHEKKAKLALLIANDLDLSKVKTSAVSKEKDKLFNDLVTKDKTAKRTNKIPTSKGFFDNIK